MSAITIRNLDDAVVAAIKRRAADNGVSMEEEIDVSSLRPIPTSGRSADGNGGGASSND